MADCRDFVPDGLDRIPVHNVHMVDVERNSEGGAAGLANNLKSLSRVVQILALVIHQNVQRLENHRQTARRDDVVRP